MNEPEVRGREENVFRKTLHTASRTEDVNMFRLLTLKHALRLEIKGLKRHGRTVYAIVKSEFGFRGSKIRVLEQLEQLINEKKGS